MSRENDINNANRNADFYEAASLQAQAAGEFERAVEFRRDAERHRKYAKVLGTNN